MADDAQYESHKRKYEEDTSPPRQRRPTGFSDGPPPAAAPFGNVPPPLEDFQLAKQKIQELASLAFNAEAKRSKFDNGGYGSNANVLSDQKPLSSNIQVGGAAHGYSGSSDCKKIEIPNGRVGVIIGKAGDTIKNLQIQSGARIQVTRDSEHDPSLPHRTVDLMGNPDQIAKAEQLIYEVLAEADAGGPGSVSRRMPGSSGSEPYVLKVPNNKVGLVIGKGGETIKNIQTRSGARVQVIPLHLPPGDAPMERTVQIDGTSEQIEVAKQMVNEVIENRLRNPAMTGGYSQQGYQARPPTNWAPQPPQMQQPAGYGYMQQPGAYPGASSQYNQQPYPGYPPQNWDQSSASQTQQPQGTGYDYYGQQQPQTQQQQPPNGPQTASTGYNYSQPPTSGGYSQQGYSQEGYATGYQGYGQPTANPQSGYDQRQGYGSTPGYGNAANPPTQDGHPPAYGTQGETGQTPSSGQPQQGYIGSQPSPNPAYPTQPGYGVPPTSQPSYGTSSVPQAGAYPGYGPPQGQKTPPNPSVYGQPQQSPSQVGGYAPPAAGQPGYPPSQPSAPPGAAASYGAGTAQSGAYPQAYGAPPVTPPSYGQQPYYGGAYSQPAAYPSDDNGVAAAAPAPASQPAAQPNGAAKASPQS
ncbi:calcium-binding protein P-like [Chenopodium quinoa]|uniref:calcium-binding protein P-like n=1 Tax=Chenopodium quinoa TaxID=63459 RepID=UPI000B780917|nr:calcium-binding protein P-like [Chenopodium quinoa]